MAIVRIYSEKKSGGTTTRCSTRIYTETCIGQTNHSDYFVRHSYQHLNNNIALFLNFYLVFGLNFRIILNFGHICVAGNIRVLKLYFENFTEGRFEVFITQ